MGDQIRVTFGAMEQLQGDIGTRVSNIQGHLDTLQSQIAGLQELWQGGSSEGFQATKKAWDDSALHLKEVLAKIQIAVQTSTDGYAQAESRNAARW